MERKYIKLLGITIDRITLKEVLEYVDHVITTNLNSKIMYANIHTMNISFADRSFYNILNKAGIVYCDGEGIKWGARILGKFLPQRMTGADWIWDLCEMCGKKDHSLYLLGGEGGVAEKAAKRLMEKFPDLKIAGTYHGYFLKYGEENDKVIDSINKKSPDILLVGFGSPLQEKWIHENFGKLNSCVVWAVGAMMDFVSEKVPRGPRWMLDNDMEWLFRLIIEPGRMWKRYIIGNVVFFKRIIEERLSEKA